LALPFSFEKFTPLSEWVPRIQRSARITLLEHCVDYLIASKEHCVDYLRAPNKFDMKTG
jgi:hypothetical protein